VIVSLRPGRPADLRWLTGGESEFDEFGPREPRIAPASSRLDGDGGLVIVVDGQDEPAGELTWHWQRWGPNHGSRCPMIGIWLRPGHRGQTIGRAAQAMVAQMFFAHTTANRVEAHTDVENIAEQRALEAAGFQREGVTRGAQWRAGAYHDGILYAILRDDSRPSS
jgi:RimJ/RimL family protein N-acetyltransferase